MATPDFRVRNRIFATVPPKAPGTVNVKMDPVSVAALTRSHPDTYRDVWGGRWVGVRLDRLTEARLHTWLADAWALAAPKMLRRQYPDLA